MICVQAILRGPLDADDILGATPPIAGGMGASTRSSRTNLLCGPQGAENLVDAPRLHFPRSCIPSVPLARLHCHWLRSVCVDGPFRSSGPFGSSGPFKPNVPLCAFCSLCVVRPMCSIWCMCCIDAFSCTWWISHDTLLCFECCKCGLCSEWLQYSHSGLDGPQHCSPRRPVRQCLYKWCVGLAIPTSCPQ